jgi:hypothetical protein
MESMPLSYVIYGAIMNEKLKNILHCVITGFICLIIGAGGCFVGIYFYPTLGLRDAQRLIQSTKDKFELSRQTIEGLDKQLIDANGTIDKLTKSTKLSVESSKQVNGTIQRSQSINYEVGNILAKYDKTK